MEIESANRESAASDFWHERRVLLTGATGIIGSWLAKDLLAAGAEVVALILDADYRSELYRSRDVERVRVVEGNLEDFGVVERAINQNEVQTIFHLAAQTIVGTAQRSPRSTFETNIRGTYNLLEACRLHAASIEQVVVASSDKAYGEQPDLPYREDMTLNGRHPYDVSKSCADMIAQSYHHSYQLPITITRCGNVYGGGDLNWSRIVPSTIRSCLRAERPVIRSDGEYVRNYIYVRDVARAFIRLAERARDKSVLGEAFNFSTEEPLPVIELVRTIERVMDCQHLKPDIRDCATGEIREQNLSSAKARKILEWKPEYTLEQGLVETIEWYRNYLS